MDHRTCTPSTPLVNGELSPNVVISIYKSIKCHFRVIVAPHFHQNLENSKLKIFANWPVHNRILLWC